ENFLFPQVRKNIVRGKMVYPLNKNVVQQFIGARDIGEIATKIFLNARQYIGKTLPVAVEQMDMHQVTDLFSKVMHKEIKFQKLPSWITRLFMGKNLFQMFEWVDHNQKDYTKEISLVQSEFSGLLSLKDWIRFHFEKHRNHT